MSDSPFDEVEDEQVLRTENDLSIGSLLSEGVDGLLSVTGAIAVVGLAVVTALTAVFVQSLALQMLREFRRLARDPVAIEAFEDALRQFSSTNAALDIPITVSLVALLLLPIVSETVRIVAIRAFHADEYNGIPADLATRRLGWAVLSTFVGGILLGIAVGFGALLFIVPGLIVFIGTVVFKQEVAIADKGIIEAIRGSWNLTKGSRWELFGLMVILFVIGIGVGIARGIVDTVLITATGSLALNVYLLGPLTTAVISVFAIAVVTEAYGRLVRQKRGSPDEVVDDTDDQWSTGNDDNAW